MGLQVPPQVLLGLANTWEGDQTYEKTLTYTGTDGAVITTTTVSPSLNGEGGNQQLTSLINGNDSAGINSFVHAFQVTVFGNLTYFGMSPVLSAPTVASGTVYQNSTNRYISLYLPVYAATSGTSGTLAFALGASSTPSTIWTRYVNGSTSSTATDPVLLRIPPGLYWSVTTSSATLGTPTQIEE